ncbi:hypothetical protein BDD12DRAFT_800913 [Trichophaea hybrida]|nr:hypothetical protein BDD12DRAFT_800913 [Trichophaea hybrida]
MQPQLDLSSEATPISPFPTTIPHLLPKAQDDVTHTNFSGITDRAKLIERIKAGETPTWIPTRNLTDRYYPNHSPTSAPRLTDDHPDRPQSALHQGIFTSEGRDTRDAPGSPTAASTPFQRCGFTERTPAPLQTFFPHGSQCTHHVRTPSLSSSFILKTPTSPLVHSSNTDADGSSDESTRPPSTEPIDIGFSERRARRKSLPPSALSTLQLSSTAVPFGSIPHRRTAPNHWDDPMSPTTSRHSRRLSGIGGTSSELPFGSFVGSYEESILNGRMSTTPSKPLNFLAQIGVLGLGKCKQSLRCPTHVTLPFPAYFYSVGDYDSPSPYVGQIDLESALGSQSSKGKKPPPGVGGSYRIPQRGQLQIVIKNPNKTAVKLFLVPYDLRDMEPGTKTFIRQKAYSVGEAPGPDLPISPLTRQKEKDSYGRYYIFKSIRVVFANRVPDGKERLRNEALWPEPKYSTWKPEAISCATTPTAGRKRSASLYGVRQGGAAATGGRTRTPPPPLSLLMKPPPGPTDSSALMDVDDGGTSAYEKVDLSGSLKKIEGRGLLARRLKELEVETQKDEQREVEM